MSPFIGYKRWRCYFITVNSGCYLASSITSHCKILQLGSMRVYYHITRLISGEYPEICSWECFLEGLEAPPYPPDTIGGLDAEPQRSKKIIFFAKIT